MKKSPAESAKRAERSGRRSPHDAMEATLRDHPAPAAQLGGNGSLLAAQVTDDVTQILREAYDRRVEERTMRPAPAWETAERDIFLEVLRRERITTLLELGAATGSDAAFFKDHGFDVVCVDLSPQMVERCRARGLVAHVMDVADLRLPPNAYGAVCAMNCLVHVPNAQLRGVLAGISRVIKPGGLFYVGLYGGREFEGVWDDDSFEPKRFFCHHSDEALRGLVREFFGLESFRCISHGWNGLHFQSLILRRPSAWREERYETGHHW